MSNVEPVLFSTYLRRLQLRTHDDQRDTRALASIFSDPFSRRYLSFLQPPQGWKNIDDQRWTEEDFLDRVNVQRQTRAKGQSCVLNIILLDSSNGESEGRCIGATGFVRIDHPTGYLGIITDPSTTRQGYATEALHGAIEYAFDKLDLSSIMMQTDERNEPMRNWCEKLAQIPLRDKQSEEINGFQFVEYNYLFTREQWNQSIKQRLEERMNVLSPPTSN